MSDSNTDPTSKNKPQGSVNKKRGILLRLISYVRPYRRLFVSGLFFTVFLSFLNPARPYLVQYIMDYPIMEGNLEAVRFWVVILIGLLVLQVVMTYYQIWITNLLGQSIINDLRVKIFCHMTNLRMKYFDRNAIGILQTRAISDIQTLNNVFSEGLVSIVGEILQLGAILGLMFYTNWKLTLVVLSILPFLLLVVIVFKKAVTSAFRRVRKYVADLNAFLQEHITGMSVVQIFNREEREKKKFDEINRKHTKAHLDTVLYYSIFFPAIELITAFALALIVWYGAFHVLEKDLTFGTLVAFLLYIQMFFRPIRMLADQFNSIQLGIVSAERIFKVLDNQEFIADLPDGKVSIPNFEDGIQIDFKNVFFAYNKPEEKENLKIDVSLETLADNQWILNDVSFSVKANTTTAIVGATGAGKSSVINILMRFYEINSGDILLNNVSIADFKSSTIRESMGLVMQDVFLFSGTVYENITLGDESISRESVIQAAKVVGVHDFIAKLPGGYDFKVGERGVALSTGQRQLLSFIRVLVANPRILLLDEATANIDSETESLIQHAINTVLSNRTSIIIAHRLSTIQKADQIIVLNKGIIVEKGSHQELLSLNGYYKRLFLLQHGREVIV